MRNFAVLHRTGKILYSRNFQGDPLERNIVIGFASSLPNLTRSLLHEDVQQVVGQHSYVVLKSSGNYLFLAHVNRTVPSFVAQNLLSELIHSLQLIYGHPDTWTSDCIDFDGAQDLLELMCTKGMSDPCVALRGMHKIPIKSESRVRLDKLLVYLESIQGICNNASMLLVGDMVILSRFELEPSRQMLYLHKARPLRHMTSCFTPVFMNASWFGLIRLQLGAYTLLVLCHMERTGAAATSAATPVLGSSVPTGAGGGAGGSGNSGGDTVRSAGATTTPLSVLLAKLGEFAAVFQYARLELPQEEKPALLRQYAKRETLLFLHLHTKTGAVTFPQPRPLPEVQARELHAVFWALVGDAKNQFSRNPGTREVGGTREAYRFFARCDPDQELYVLFAADAVGLEHVGSHVSEILLNLQRFSQ
ncbi:hypothetical protein BC828DRAFT_378542 [Blastocladiella britannica]|nr:hypothetical protein BC828DRAFT_378542 [Blastocladiella britannica]